MPVTRSTSPTHTSARSFSWRKPKFTGETVSRLCATGKFHSTPSATHAPRPAMPAFLMDGLAKNIWRPFSLSTQLYRRPPRSGRKLHERYSFSRLSRRHDCGTRFFVKFERTEY